MSASSFGMTFAGPYEIQHQFCGHVHAFIAKPTPQFWIDWRDKKEWLKELGYRCLKLGETSDSWIVLRDIVRVPVAAAEPEPVPEPPREYHVDNVISLDTERRPRCA
jgi:hypothetical protein